MGQTRVKRLVFEIEVAKQKLQYAIASNRDDLAFDTQKQLANLNAMLLAQTKTAQPSQPNEKYWLVFCESFQDGRVCTQIEYRALYKQMDAMDRECHVAIEVDGPPALVEQALIFETADRRNVKRTG